VRLRELGIESEILRLPHAKLSHRRRLLTSCREIRPDVLVLQLGHAELNQPLSHYLRTRFAVGEKSTASDWESTPSPLPSATAFQFRSVIKWLIDAGLGHPLADLGRLRSLWDLLLADVQKAEVPVILVMSPLPCADRTRLHYRQVALPIFQETAARYRSLFVDVLSLATSFRSSRFGADEHYFDGMHLGSLGHSLVGQAIAEALVNAVESKGQQVSRS
jgi:lysophospholipase L1-like esterase